MSEKTPSGITLPIGMMAVFFPGMDLSLEQWAVPYGQWLKEEEYPDLFSVMGKKYGYNEDTREFRLPQVVEFKDLRNLVRLTCGEPPIIKSPTYFMKIK